MQAPIMADAAPITIVLVHGACHGGWCWYKVAARLRSSLAAASFRVLTPDLAASGVDERRLREVPTFRDYTAPLLDLLRSLPDGEKAILVGHSLGGLSVALAAEEHPEKVAAAVFLCAFMPDCTSPPSHGLLKVIERMHRFASMNEFLMGNGLLNEKFVVFRIQHPYGTIESNRDVPQLDNEIKPPDNDGKLPASFMFGPQTIEQNVYQLCSNEDKTLAKSLMRVGSLFLEDLNIQKPLSKDRYGSVRKVYIVAEQDRAISEGLQRWMVSNNPVEEVKEIETADHMAMISTPDDVAQYIVDITKNYN
ncbi:hypothetical protein EJB05_28279, partial [Eragrostis curvula]